MCITKAQYKYIDVICDVLELEYPTLSSKKEATEWLNKYAPIYQKCKKQVYEERCLYDELFGINHENAGDRI